MSDRRLLTTDNRLLTTASPLIDGREIDETFWVRLRPNRKSARSIPLASEGRCLRRPEMTVRAPRNRAHQSVRFIFAMGRSREPQATPLRTDGSFKRMG